MPELIKYRFDSDMVEIRVGQEAKLFRVHKEALRKALNGTFSDGFEQRIFSRA